jgi:hypothetical protein
LQRYILAITVPFVFFQPTPDCHVNETTRAPIQ